MVYIPCLIMHDPCFCPNVICYRHYHRYATTYQLKPGLIYNHYELQHQHFGW